MTKKTYLPQFAKTMNYFGKYAFEHHAKLHETIDAFPDLNDEQKEMAKRVIDEVMESHEIFNKLWIAYLNGKI